MTLIVSIHGPETIWLLADRRLSYESKAPKDDARKVMHLEAADGVALLGYAGLGATALGTEPADWMSAVLRGRRLPLEQSLRVLADAINNQLRPHILRMPKGSAAHTVVIPAFIGEEPRLYMIDLALAPDSKGFLFCCTRHVSKPSGMPPRIVTAGTGGLYLDRYIKKKWSRHLFRLIKANDSGQISAVAVGDHLAKLNHEVHLGIRDKTVGPRCIVVWQHRRGGVHRTGGGYQFYSGTVRDKESLEDIGSPGIPTIAGGMDVDAIMRATAPGIMKQMREAMKAGKPMKLDEQGLNAALARLPTEPDEKLR